MVSILFRPGWLLTLGDSIDSLEGDVLEKEQELRQLRNNLSEMQQIYTKAINETKIKRVLVQKEKEEEKVHHDEKSQALYEQVANHLSHEIFMDKVVNSTVELQQRQQQEQQQQHSLLYNDNNGKEKRKEHSANK